ncbi:unnamed protein product [Oncorhynchus mykiss]|uniref:Uncharacterized protein n=1 Tax=Oncorhynchus mykiss TaxID=8022 RepID=A0A060Z072_ONCMY|nr:unnamed protein product [Oncorhynchus mykiss]
MSPRYPGGPRPSLRMPNQVKYPPPPPKKVFSTRSMCLICEYPLWESQGHSLSCQTAWTPPDHRVNTSHFYSFCNV